MTYPPAIRQQRSKTVDDQVTLVRKALISLNGAFKKALLYPQGHAIYQTALKSLKINLDLFFNYNVSLILTIDRSKVCFNDEVVYKDHLDQDNFAYILFRDGIKQIEFKPHIELWELHLFLEVLQKNQVLTEEAESDIVTALWELELPSVNYEAEDVGFETCEEFKIPELGGQDLVGTAEELKPESNVQMKPDTDLQTLIHDWNLLEITPEDQRHIKTMVVEEQEWERIEYVLYILLYILEQKIEPEDFSEVMSYLRQELQDAIQNQDYHIVYTTLRTLRRKSDALKKQAHWSTLLLDEFFESISQKSFIDNIRSDLINIKDCDLQQISYLKRALILLNANAMDVLGAMTLEVTTNKARKLLKTVIAILAESNYSHFEKIISSASTDLLKVFIQIMGSMKNARSYQLLLKLLNHALPEVRLEALKAVFGRAPDKISDHSWILEDADQNIQHLFLKFIGRQRDTQTEKMLLAYLEKKHIRPGNKQLLFQAYLTLGRCGSDESIPFLKKHIFFLPALNILRLKKSLRRQAAVHALEGLNTAQAKSILARVAG